MVARRGHRDGHDLPIGRVVPALEVAVGPEVVLEIAEREEPVVVPVRNHVGHLAVLAEPADIPAVGRGRICAPVRRARAHHVADGGDTNRLRRGRGELRCGDRGGGQTGDERQGRGSGEDPTRAHGGHRSPAYRPVSIWARARRSRPPGSCTWPRRPSTRLGSPSRGEGQARSSLASPNIRTSLWDRSRTLSRSADRPGLGDP